MENKVGFSTAKTTKIHDKLFIKQKCQLVLGKDESSNTSPLFQTPKFHAPKFHTPKKESQINEKELQELRKFAKGQGIAMGANGEFLKFLSFSIP